MGSCTDSQNSVQNPPLQQPQTNLLSDLAPATTSEITNTSRPTTTTTDGIDVHLNRLRRQRLSALSKTFGNIPNIPIFTNWSSRLDCCSSAVHRAIMAGICGNRHDGTYSVALSDLYNDDEDGGDVIIYTGAGGRKRWSDSIPPKRLLVGPQIEDQSWDYRPNKALMVSCHTGNPVRVIRSWRCKSQYAPLRGYRYDGLYRVVACWTARGSSGLNICRCRFERLPNQPPIPLQEYTCVPRWRECRTFNASTSSNDDQTCLAGESSQWSCSEHRFLPEPVPLKRCTWDPLPVPSIQQDLCEDDATVTPSEDDHGNDGKETEYFSDVDN